MCVLLTGFPQCLYRCWDEPSERELERRARLTVLTMTLPALLKNTVVLKNTVYPGAVHTVKKAWKQHVVPVSRCVSNAVSQLTGD